MNYIRETEETLRRYRDLDWIIAGLQREYDRLSLKGAPRDISAVDFQAIHGGSSGEDAIATMYKMGDIDSKMEDLLAEKERIETTLEKIKEHDEISYNFIQERYIKGSTLEEVADGIGYSINSKTSLCNIKDKALKQFIFYYFGKL